MRIEKGKGYDTGWYVIQYNKSVGYDIILFCSLSYSECYDYYINH